MRRMRRRIQCWLSPNWHPGFVTTHIAVLADGRRVGYSYTCVRCGTENPPKEW
jgi:hypothetical protein